MPQTRPRPLPRFSWYRCVFSKENEEFSADASQVQEKSVEAAQSLLQEGGFDVAEQRVDARMPQRITAMAAVTKAMESDPEARQTSMRVYCGRCHSLRPVQFCWSFFRVQCCCLAVVSRPCPGLDLLRTFTMLINWSSTQQQEVSRLRAGIEMEQCKEKFVFVEIFMTGNSVPVVQRGMRCGRNKTYTKR